MPEPARPVLLTDDDLQAVDPAQAVAWMREAVVAAEQGRLTAPARVHAELGAGDLVFTAGALAGEWFGYRSYDTFDVEPGEQVVVLHSADTGRVAAVAVGNALGPMRTGALGGLAVDLLARADASSVGLVGAGTQAWNQLWAIAGCRSVRRVDVFARTPEHRDALAALARDRLGLDCSAVADPEEAVRDHDIVVLATTSRTPVIDVGWLASGAHVSTVGPKRRDAAEFGLDLVEAADVVATDSLAQLHGYEPPNLVASSRHADRVRSLGAVALGTAAGRHRDTDLTVYLSVGLAGTEVHLLRKVADALGVREE